MSKVYQIDELSAAVVEALMEYNRAAVNGTKEEVKKAAQRCAKDIRASSQAAFDTHNAGGKSYSKGWTYKKTFENSDDIRYEVFNNTKPSLTHLLEYGHRKWLWGRPTDDKVKGRSHIRPVSEMVADALVTNIKLRLG